MKTRIIDRIISFMIAMYLFAVAIFIVQFFFIAPYESSIHGVEVLDVSLYSAEPLLHKIFYLSNSLIIIFLIYSLISLSVLFLFKLIRRRKFLIISTLIVLVWAYIIIHGLLNLYVYKAYSVNQLAIKMAGNLLYITFVPLLLSLPGILLFILLFRGMRRIRSISSRSKRRTILSFLYLITAVIVLHVLISIVVFCWEFVGLHSAYTKEMSQRKSSHTKSDVNVILVLADALRARQLGCYGNEKEVSPFIDSLACEGTRSDTCYAQASWTCPSCVSLLTSLYPSMHHVSSDAGMPDEAVTLAEVMHDNGYVTYCYLANPSIRKIYNFNQGFDYFDDYLMRDTVFYAAVRNLPTILKRIIKILGIRGFSWEDRDNARIANKRIFSWLERNSHNNFFLYLHYMDPHSPYTPPFPYNNKFLGPSVYDERTRLLAMYNGEIRFFDDEFKALVDKLKSLGLYKKTIIIFVADHGEAFLEHGQWEHAKSVYEEEVRVPLIIHLNSGKAQRRVVKDPVRLIDVMPTIVDLLDLKADIAMEGESLIPLLLVRPQQTKSSDRDVYIELDSGDHMSVSGALIEDGKWKYIHTLASEIRDIEKEGGEELYNLNDDPKETQNLVDHDTARANRMKIKYEQFKAYCNERALPERKVERTFEITEQMRALGYLQ